MARATRAPARSPAAAAPTQAADVFDADRHGGARAAPRRSGVRHRRRAPRSRAARALRRRGLRERARAGRASSRISIAICRQRRPAATAAIRCRRRKPPQRSSGASASTRRSRSSPTTRAAACSRRGCGGCCAGSATTTRPCSTADSRSGSAKARPVTRGIACRRRRRLSCRRACVPPSTRRASRRACRATTLLLLDARAAERYRGDVEPLDPVAGHIPGALNRPYARNLAADGTFRPARELRSEFDAMLHGRSADDVVHYCGSGVSACHNVLAMAVAGYPLHAALSGLVERVVRRSDTAGRHRAASSRFAIASRAASRGHVASARVPTRPSERSSSAIESERRTRQRSARTSMRGLRPRGNGARASRADGRRGSRRERRRRAARASRRRVQRDERRRQRRRRRSTRRRRARKPPSVSSVERASRRAATRVADRAQRRDRAAGDAPRNASVRWTLLAGDGARPCARRATSRAAPSCGIASGKREEQPAAGRARTQTSAQRLRDVRRDACAPRSSLRVAISRCATCSVCLRLVEELLVLGRVLERRRRRLAALHRRASPRRSSRCPLRAGA